VHWGVISAKAARIYETHLTGFMTKAEWLGGQCEQIPRNNEQLRVITAAREVSHRSVVSPQLRYRTWPLDVLRGHFTPLVNVKKLLTVSLTLALIFYV